MLYNKLVPFAIASSFTGFNKHTGFLCYGINYRFFDKGPWGLYYKTFYGRNLKIFLISLSVCPWQASAA